MKEVREWVTHSFSNIPSKPELVPRQNFQQVIKPGQKELFQNISTPFDNRTMILMNSIRDECKMTIMYTFEANQQRRQHQKSYYFVNQLLGHEGQGSLYQSLRDLNLIEELCTEDLNSFKTLVDLVSIEITLTAEGRQKFQEVLQFVHEYIEKAVGWTAQDLTVFEESKIIADLSFTNAYQVPDQWDNVTNLATNLLFVSNPANLLKETYSEAQLYEIDKADIQSVLKQMTYDNCKVVLSAKNICSKDQFMPIKQPTKDQWFKTTYMVVKKPKKQLNQSLLPMSVPKPNKFLPKHTNLIYKGAA